MKFTRYIALFFAALTLSTFIFSVGRVVAAETDEIFFSGNTILFYDPVAKKCSVTEIAGTGDNKGNSYNYFIAKGLTGIQSAAIVGNFMQESGVGVDPKALNSIGAYGIAQWLGGRKDNLMKEEYYTSGATDPSRELQAQLDFVWKELQGSESGSYRELTSATTTDAGELAVIFGEAYERYGSTEEGNRAQYAKDVLAQYGGTGVVSEGGSSSSCANSGAGVFVYYSQRDPKWAEHSYGAAGTIGPAGCGPTSMAMVVATLADKTVTPVETADLGVANGSAFEGGTIHLPLVKAAADKWGLTYSDISSQPFSAAIEAVKAGSLVYMGGSGAAPFTSGGHVIVMRGVTPEGNIIIGDPYRNAADVYPPEVVEAGRGTTFIMSKG